MQKLGDVGKDMENDGWLSYEDKENAVAFLKGIPLTIKTASEAFVRSSEEPFGIYDYQSSSSHTHVLTSRGHTTKPQSFFKRSISTLEKSGSEAHCCDNRSSLVLNDDDFHRPQLPLMRSTKWQREKMKLNRSVLKMKYITNEMLSDKRVVFVEPHHKTPFVMLSVLPHGKSLKANKSVAHHSKEISKKANFTDAVPLVEDPDAVIMERNTDTLTSYELLLEPSSDSTAVPVDLGSSEWRSGKHRTLLALRGYVVSVIDHAKPSELKRNLNLKFRRTFPHVNVTLSKIRSLEQQMTSVAKLFDLQSGVLTLAVSYFERLVFGSKVVKANRHHVAATCLLLSAKVHGDLRPDVLTQLISSLEHSLKTSKSLVRAFEFPVFAALGFSLVS